MNKYKSIEDFKKTVQRITEAETNDFFELAEILGRDPKTDLAGANLSEVNLQGGDLEGANLRCTDLSRADLSNVNLIGADLSRANLRGANLSSADLSNANLTDADLTYANLTDTKLSNITVENTRFGNNLGIDQTIKQELTTKKAVTEDFQEFGNQKVSNLPKANKPSIAGFFKYTFLGQKANLENLVTNDQPLSGLRIAPIYEFNVVSEQETEPKSLDRKFFFTQIIVTINWFLLVIGALSFCFIVYNAVYQENAIASEIIYHSFSLVLGWYGGLITSYLREK